MKSKKKSGLQGFIEIVLTVAVAVGLALLIQAFVVKPYRIPSPSMVPTLEIGQRVLTNRLISHPSVGDIVVFHPPHGADNEDDPVCANPNQGAGHPQACDKGTSTESDQTFIKRVVAGPGDTISIINGHVIRNGVREKDSLYPAVRGRSFLHIPETDHDSARRVLHDGRQPWSLRRQPFLGTSPRQMGHRCCLLHVLATRPYRHPLTPVSRPDRHPLTTGALARPPSRASA